MIAYLIFGILISILLIFFLKKIAYLPKNKFKTFFKVFIFLILIFLLLFLIRINPNFFGLFPAIFLFFIKWRNVLSFIISFLSYKKKRNNNLMTRKEALEILGLDESAGKNDILKSYYSLLKKNHPDVGGSDWVTARLNKAKETLLG